MSVDKKVNKGSKEVKGFCVNNGLHGTKVDRTGPSSRTCDAGSWFLSAPLYTHCPANKSVFYSIFPGLKDQFFKIIKYL